MSWKSQLALYIRNPAQYPELVMFANEDVVLIRDKFPKSTVHFLMLLRDSTITHSHPTTAITEERKASLAPHIDKAKGLVYEQFKDCVPDLQVDRQAFIDRFVQVGVHSVPSMNNIHIHILSKDFHSTSMKNKKHYNSFTTRFFVPWEQLPLKAIPKKDLMEDQFIKEHDLICCYCGENMKNRFVELKKHLDIEFTRNFNGSFPLQE